MTIHTTTAGRWRCTATRSDDQSARHIEVELDSNFGGIWPRVVLSATQQLDETTSISVAPPGIADQRFDGPSGMSYQQGIHEHCISPILKGAATALRGRSGVRVEITSGGVAVDTAEAVCERAAEVAVRMLGPDELTPELVEEVLKQVVSGWDL